MGQLLLPLHLIMGGVVIYSNGTNLFAAHAAGGGAFGTMAYQNANAVAITGGNIDGTVIGNTTASTATITDLTFDGDARRIFGNFSDLTISDRVFFESVGTDQRTLVCIKPTGTVVNAISGIELYGTNDPDNAGHLSIRMEESNAVVIDSGKNGTGTYVPIIFEVSGSPVWEIETTGNLVKLNGSSIETTNIDVAELITGDFSNATLADRTFLKTTTTNGATSVGAIPNGTGPGGNFVFYDDEDPANSGFLEIGHNTSDAYINTGKTGTGSLQFLRFQVEGAPSGKLVL